MDGGKACMEKWREEGQKELVIFKQVAGLCACLGDPGLAHPRKKLLQTILWVVSPPSLCMLGCARSTRDLHVVLTWVLNPSGSGRP